MYFDKFPLVFYDIKGKGRNFQLVTNITNKVGFRSKVLKNASYFEKYSILEGETPESLAYDIYGNAELHWIILLANTIKDRYYEWPMSYQQFIGYVNSKYTNVNALHHYEISQTSGVSTKKISIGTDNTDYPSATTITNFEYEESVQEEMRGILIIKPLYVTQVIAEFEGFMAGIS